LIPRRLPNRFLFLFVLFFFLFALPVGWYAHRVFYESYLTELQSQLESIGRLVEQRVSDRDGLIQSHSLDQICSELGKASNTKIRLILPNGTVVGYSEAGSRGMAKQSDLEDVNAALSGEVGRSIRYSLVYRQMMTYVSIPVTRQDKVVGVVQTSRPLDLVIQQVRSALIRIGITALLIFAGMACIYYWLVRKTFMPVDVLREGLANYSRGDLSKVLHVHGVKEFEDLGESANRMATQLGENYQKIISRRNRLDAVLAALEEGVVFFDSKERINTINRAASGLLGVDQTESVGRTLQEVIRNADMQKFCLHALQSNIPLDEEIMDGEKTWIVHSTRLFDPEMEDFGTLVVISDITRLLKLESIRKDFVANVSHELRTPITSIKGFLETLQDGAIDQPEEAKRFLDILIRHTTRLEAIIEDLLTLSGLDREKTERTTPRINTEIGEIVRSVVKDSEPYARSRQIRLNVLVDEEINLSVDPSLVSHAIQNLLDNAIKYSEPEGEVRVRARNLDEEVQVEVVDNGCGIESTHLDRIFERFYRVDPARSRKLGGTGLGLSIVKNVMQIHEGRVTVKSVLEEGSTFVLHFPKN